MSTEITEGSWPAKITNWEIVEVPKVNQLKLVIWFKVDGDGWEKAMKWEGFFLRVDGTQNANTYKTLRTCGFNSQDVGDLLTDDNSLDKETEFTVTTEQNEKGYWFIKWVNTESWTDGAVKDVSVLKGHNLGKLNSFLGTPKPKKTKTDEEIDDFLN